jgi:hypothetical protein
VVSASVFCQRDYGFLSWRVLFHPSRYEWAHRKATTTADAINIAINRVFPLLRPKPSANNAHNALVTIAQKTAITEACNHVSAAGGRIFFSGKISFSISKAGGIVHCSDIERTGAKECELIVDESRRSRNFAPFVRQIAEGKRIAFGKAWKRRNC